VLILLVSCQSTENPDLFPNKDVDIVIRKEGSINIEYVHIEIGELATIGGAIYEDGLIGHQYFGHPIVTPAFVQYKLDDGEARYLEVEIPPAPKDFDDKNITILVFVNPESKTARIELRDGIALD
jgi:hypothetical protein